MALYRGASDTPLERSKIINRDYPTQPTPTLSRAGTHSLTERRLVGCRMIKNTDHLEIVPVGQRQYPVASAETRMESTVKERHS
jgi:hypothetical protein